MTKLPEKMDFPGSMLFRKAKLITNIDFVFTQAEIAEVLRTENNLLH
jgi:hypothetical protein